MQSRKERSIWNANRSALFYCLNCVCSFNIAYQRVLCTDKYIFRHLLS
jgi:hypothetical protein